MNFKSFNINNKIFLKLLIGFILVSVTIFFTVTFVMYLAAQKSKEAHFKNKLINISELFISSYASVYKATTDENLAFNISSKLIEKLDNIRLIRIWDTKQHILIQNYAGEKEFDVDKQGITDGMFKTIHTSQKNYLKTVRSFRIENQQERFIELFSSIDDVEKITIDTLIRTMLVTAIIIIIIIPLFYILSRNILFPINQISLDIQKIKNSSPSKWKQLKQYSDNTFLNEIIVSINELIFRAQRSLVCQENIGRFLSHEIKAPLTNLLNEIEITRREVPAYCAAKDKNEIFCSQAVADIMKIRSIVNNICGLAYIDSEVSYDESINVAELIESTIKEFQHIYKYSVLFENMIAPESAIVNINKDYFWILCSNILRNSIEHGDGDKRPPLVQLSQGDEWYVITFSDSGPGFPFSQKFLDDMKGENNLNQLLQSHGAGLVLSLKLAEIMGIDINFQNHLPSGAKVTFSIEKKLLRT